VVIASVPTVSSADRGVDEVQHSEGSLDAWSLWSIASSSSRRVQIERTVASVIDGVTDYAAS
jgi:hypothetical protein